MNAIHYLRVINPTDVFYCQPLDADIAASVCVGAQVYARDTESKVVCRRCIYGWRVAENLGVEFDELDLFCGGFTS